MAGPGSNRAFPYQAKCLKWIRDEFAALLRPTKPMCAACLPAQGVHVIAGI